MVPNETGRLRNGTSLIVPNTNGSPTSVMIDQRLRENSRVIRSESRTACTLNTRVKDMKIFGAVWRNVVDPVTFTWPVKKSRFF